MKNNNLLKQIEEKKKELVILYNNEINSFEQHQISQKIIKKSQEIDLLLNKYVKKNENSKN